jgi:PAS domain S-box-containing protein
MTRLSVANRLRIGLALLLALLLAAYVLAVRQGQPDTAPVKRAMSQAESKRSVIAAMQASLEESWSASEAFVRDRDAVSVAAFKQADGKFGDALKRYTQSAASDEQRALAREIGAQHVRYAADVNAVLSAGAAPDNVEPFYDYQQRALRALLADMPEAKAERESARTQRKREAVRQLRELLQQRAELFAQPPMGPLPDAQEAISAVARYQAFADTSAERAWAERAARALRDGDRQAGAVAETLTTHTAALDKARASYAALHSLVTLRAHASVGPDVAGLLQQASQGARLANARLADMLLVLLGAGVVVALLTMYAVRAPLRQLAASTRGYVGDLSFLSLAAPGDEVAELRWAVNRLVDRVQAGPAGETTAAAAQSTGDERMRHAALAFEHDSHALLLTDERLNVVAVNAAFTELTGFTREEIKGASPSTLWSPDHYDRAAIAAAWAEVDERGGWQGEVIVRTKSGDVRPVSAVIKALRDPQGVLQHALVELSDRALMHPADDERTPFAATPGVPRDPISQVARSRLAEANGALPTGAALAVMRLHVQTLHSVVAALGDTDAQHLLAEIRARVSGAAGERAEVIDNDGQEPVVLVPAAQDTLQVARIAHDVVSALSAPARFNGLELPVTVHIGIARTPVDGETVEALVDAAAAALERARSDRGGAFEFTSQALSTRMRECIALQGALLDPALSEQLLLHYQPVLALRSGRAIGMEALLRWRHPVRGLLEPAAFLEHAAQAGVLPDIGAWVLRTACKQARRWLDSGLPPLRIAVNLSRPELESSALADHVRQALQESNLDAKVLQLEVSEAILDGAPDIGPALSRLESLGVVLTLACAPDSDRASRALTWLPFTRIKFRTPVKVQDAVPSIASLARSLNVCVVAERVETEAQAAALRGQDVDELQGFLVGRPAAAREFELRIRHASARAAPTPVPADAS